MARNENTGALGGPRPLSEYDRYAGPIIAEKLHLLRLVRAIDATGAADRELKARLRELSEYGALLTSVLDELDREGREPGPPRDDTVWQLVDAGEDARADVLEALPAGRRLATLDALRRVGVSEDDVWLEVEHMRSAGSDADSPGM